LWRAVGAVRAGIWANKSSLTLLPHQRRPSRQRLGADRCTDRYHILLWRSLQMHSGGSPVRARVTSWEAKHVSGAPDAEWWCCTSRCEARRILRWKSPCGWQGYRIREPPNLHWIGRQVECPWPSLQKFVPMDYQLRVWMSLFDSPS
jgi:hypothetical protein